MNKSRIFESKIQPTLEFPMQWPELKTADGYVVEPPATSWERYPCGDEMSKQAKNNKHWTVLQRVLTAGAFAAGGFFVDMSLGQKPKDLDLYFDSAFTLKRTLGALLDLGYAITEEIIQDLEAGKSAVVITHPDNLIPINIVNMQYRNSITSFMEWFDLDVCMIGMSGTHLWQHRDWDFNFENRVMHYHVVTSWMRTQARVLKYEIKGFSLLDGAGRHSGTDITVVY